jgi:hypothetical protein
MWAENDGKLAIILLSFLSETEFWKRVSTLFSVHRKVAVVNIKRHHVE